jgi:arginine decarboxylase
MSWSIQQSRDIYNIAHWSEGYFDVSEKGTLVAYPCREQADHGVDLNELAKTFQQANLSLPVLVRFTDILTARFNGLRDAFAEAIRRESYEGTYAGVYPIKVNQQAHLIQTILKASNRHVGLEAGSKPELMAVLASLADYPNTVVICNGYKDREFIRLALIGQQLGHRVYIIIEKLSEVKIILEESAKLGVKPRLGVRVRLASIGAGQWQNTGGEKSKFGLSASKVLQVIEKLRAAGALDQLELLHIFLGSQIANILDIQKGMRECARYYAELHALGVNIQCVDVGGGLAVDYEGTRSRSYFSMNYSMQKYADHVVHALKEVCHEKDLPHPMIITESGRAMTAYHAMLIINIIDVERLEVPTQLPPATTEEPQIIQDLWHGYVTLSERSVLEAYYDACHWLNEAQTMYVHGVLNLVERARAEQIYTATCRKVQTLLHPVNRTHREVIDELNEKLADKCVGNFSLFQSLPDVWALNQVFPIIPLSGLDKPLTRRGVLHDMTCDSDGRIDLYVDGEGLESTLPLPEYAPSEPFLLGVFLVGAYQEILGDMHNLFGDADSVHVERQADGKYQLVKPVSGDTVESVLHYVNFSTEDVLHSYRQQLEKSAVTEEQREAYFSELEAGFYGYTYLED